MNSESILAGAMLKVMCVLKTVNLWKSVNLAQNVDVF